MADGVYQSVMCFFIPYLTVINSAMITENGLNIEDRVRLGCYIMHPAVLTINLYILINMYRWDWIMLLCVALSDMFIFFWTGVYTSTTYSGFFYKAAPQLYGEASFWAVFIITPVISIFPRFAIKALQKVYFPYDVDIIREQVQQGMFKDGAKPEEAVKGISSGSSDSSRKGKHAQYASVDEDRRPIYPPSVATHNTRTQNGSDGTNYTNHRNSMDGAMDRIPTRPSIDRARPSYDRMRASMDRARQSYEASNDFTTAARLSRIESSHSGQFHRAQHSSRFHTGRLRGLSIISAKSRKDSGH